VSRLAEDPRRDSGNHLATGSRGRGVARHGAERIQPALSRAYSWQVAEACLDQLQPLSGFRTGESGASGGEGGRMIAAISIGIIIIVAVIIAALAIIYFILK
jgi:hypothetical protein